MSTWQQTIEQWLEMSKNYHDLEYFRLSLNALTITVCSFTSQRSIQVNDKWRTNWKTMNPKVPYLWKLLAIISLLNYRSASFMLHQFDSLEAAVTRIICRNRYFTDISCVRILVKFNVKKYTSLQDLENQWSIYSKFIPVQ